MGIWLGLEGTDGTGKSTLAEAIRDELESRFGAATIIHKGPPEKSVLEEYATDVEGREAENLVFDRWHLGQLVYAPLYRGTGSYGESGLAGFRWVEKFLQARGATFFIVDQPYPLVKQRLESRGEDYLQSHHVEQVLERYREVQNMSVLTPSTTVSPPDDLAKLDDHVNAMIELADVRAHRAKPLRAFSSYVGPIDPSVLLVGERRGGQPPFISEACFMAVPNRSGAFLWESLPEPLWREVGAANAYEADIGALWETIGKPRVVALGEKAGSALDEAGVLHSQVPHPQWVKRFKNKEHAAYGELISRAATSGTEHLAWPRS